MIFLLLKIIFILISIISMAHLVVLCRSALALDRFSNLVTAHANLAVLVLALSQSFWPLSLRSPLLRIETRNILPSSRSLSRALVRHIIISFHSLWFLVRTPILFLVLVNDVTYG